MNTIKSFAEKGFYFFVDPDTARKIKKYDSKINVYSKFQDAIPNFKNWIVDSFYAEQFGMTNILKNDVIYLKITPQMMDEFLVETQSNKFPKGTRILNAQDTEKFIDNSQDKKSNLLEIKLKDTDSVPEVYYKGERIDTQGLTLLNYRYKTTGNSDGKNYIEMSYIGQVGEFVDLKTIKHERLR